MFLRIWEQLSESHSVSGNPSFRLPSFKLPSFKLPSFKLASFKLPSLRLPSFKPQASNVSGHLRAFRITLCFWRSESNFQNLIMCLGIWKQFPESHNVSENKSILESHYVSEDLRATFRITLCFWGSESNFQNHIVFLEIWEQLPESHYVSGNLRATSRITLCFWESESNFRNHIMFLGIWKQLPESQYVSGSLRTTSRIT